MSSSLLRGLNENDARASVIAYTRQLTVSRGFTFDSNPRIFTGTAELSELLRSGQVDLVCALTPEFLELDQHLVTGPFMLSVVNGADYVEFVLLVHAQSSAHTLADLKGVHVLVLDGPLGALAGFWLEGLLGQKALEPPETFFGSVTRPFKISRAVLPVFFHQGDACVVDRQGFTLMGELNPQVTNQLRVLATSPQLVPSVTCFRAGLDPALKEKMVTTSTQAHASAAGRQLMTIFQCDRIEVRPFSRLESTRELLAACARLRSKTGSPESAQNPPIAGHPGEIGRP